MRGCCATAGDPSFIELAFTDAVGLGPEVFGPGTEVHSESAEGGKKSIFDLLMRKHQMFTPDFHQCLPN